MARQLQITCECGKFNDVKATDIFQKIDSRWTDGGSAIGDEPYYINTSIVFAKWTCPYCGEENITILNAARLPDSREDQSR